MSSPGLTRGCAPDTPDLGTSGVNSTPATPATWECELGADVVIPETPLAGPDPDGDYQWHERRPDVYEYESGSVGLDSGDHAVVGTDEQQARCEKMHPFVAVTFRAGHCAPHPCQLSRNLCRLCRSLCRSLAPLQPVG